MKMRFDSSCREAIIFATSSEHSFLKAVGGNFTKNVEPKNFDAKNRTAMNVVPTIEEYFSDSKIEEKLLTEPATNASWKGSFKVKEEETSDGFWAHHPAKVRRKVYEFSKKMPEVIEFELLPCQDFLMDICLAKISNKEITKVAWNFVNDWLHTTMCLQYKPHYIAAGSIFLAAKILKVKLPKEKGKVWWMQFDVSPKHLEGMGIKRQRLQMKGLMLQGMLLGLLGLYSRLKRLSIQRVL